MIIYVFQAFAILVFLTQKDPHAGEVAKAAKPLTVESPLFSAAAAFGKVMFLLLALGVCSIQQRSRAKSMMILICVVLMVVSLVVF